MGRELVRLHHWWTPPYPGYGNPSREQAVLDEARGELRSFMRPTLALPAGEPAPAREPDGFDPSPLTSPTDAGIWPLLAPPDEEPRQPNSGPS